MYPFRIRSCVVTIAATAAVCRQQRPVFYSAAGSSSAFSASASASASAGAASSVASSFAAKYLVEMVA
jgi:hypothetical protein